ncbi:MAG: hypothetical protein HFI19_16050 [Lachnospiraceae bacterium]|nr:hypothetical protein [Lachnospiraceae bacterium]
MDSLLEKCQRLRKYAEFIEEIRQKLQEGLDLDHAVEEAMKYCMECGILVDILSKCRMEVRSMLLEEYDEKAEREYLRKEAIEEGRKEGLEKGFKEGIEQGIEQSTKLLIKNVLDSTHSISQTALLLKLPKEEIEKTARECGLHTNDI